MPCTPRVRLTPVFLSCRHRLNKAKVFFKCRLKKIFIAVDLSNKDSFRPSEFYSINVLVHKKGTRIVTRTESDYSFITIWTCWLFMSVKVVIKRGCWTQPSGSNTKWFRKFFLAHRLYIHIQDVPKLAYKLLTTLSRMFKYTYMKKIWKKCFRQKNQVGIFIIINGNTM
jgi:hypothetical protein